MIFVALLLQAAPAPVTRVQDAAPVRHSILIPTCAPIQRDGREVVVCGNDLSTSQRLPLPGEVVTDGPVPSNPLQNGTGALAAEGTPCAATQWGCQVGVGPPLMPMIAAAVAGIQDAVADRREKRTRRADGDRRQAIDLAATAPAGRLER